MCILCTHRASTRAKKCHLGRLRLRGHLDGSFSPTSIAHNLVSGCRPARVASSLPALQLVCVLKLHYKVNGSHLPAQWAMRKRSSSTWAWQPAQQERVHHPAQFRSGKPGARAHTSINSKTLWTTSPEHQRITVLHISSEPQDGALTA